MAPDNLNGAIVETDSRPDLFPVTTRTKRGVATDKGYLAHGCQPGADCHKVLLSHTNFYESIRKGLGKVTHLGRIGQIRTGRHHVLIYFTGLLETTAETGPG